MPTPATDRLRSSSIAVAAAAVILGALALRSVKAAAAVTAKPLPTEDLQTLAGYLEPLPSSARFPGAGGSTIVVERDPFGVAQVAVPIRVGRPGAVSPRPNPAQVQQWVVSSILFEATKRSAIVNNAWVSIGDPLGGGARLTAIERKHVVVTDANGVRHVVSIQGGEQ